MFGLSIGKLLFTVVVVMAIVVGWKWINRVQARPGSSASRVRRRAERRPPPAVEAVDMVQCPTCGDYVPAAGALSCGRPDCPYPG